MGHSCGMTANPPLLRIRKTRRIRKTAGEDLLPQHHNFIQGVAVEGLSAAASYRKYVSEPGAKMDTIWSRSCDLSKRYKERIASIRTQATDFLREQLGVTKETLLAYHVENLETPISHITEDHRLAQEMTTETRAGVGGDDPVTVKRIKMMPKSESAKELAKLAGWYPGENVSVTHTVAGLDELLSGLCRPGLPRELPPVTREAEVVAP